MRGFILSALFVSALAIILVNCHSEEKNPFLNAIPGKASYVGMDQCKACHAGIYETFMQTGMGQSWGLANKQKSAADFSTAKALVYDSIKDFYYKPYWDGDSLYIIEYRLNGKDTTHQRIEKVSYIVGSGQHTNSHIININGYLHQAPITFYTQKGKWDLAPGFEKGMNTRFDRKIEMECISCHNALPEHVQGSLNKYTNIKLGIDCERCHGPGSLHVADKIAGNMVDTATQTDYTIVNPRKLSTDQQNNLCQRCHLQGIAVLNDGKDFTDFLPSHQLNKTVNVFMPSYSDDENHMIMASHVERMKMSNCFVNSGKMSCITCHNPHVSVKFTPPQQYINACNACHAENKGCTEALETRNTKANNCITCHMPKNSSIDIPHVAVTDHYIRRKPTRQANPGVAKFIRMICYNNDQVDPRTQARGFLEFYERYEQSPAFLDSALQLLKQAGVDPERDADADLIRLYFLKEEYDKVILLSSQLKSSQIEDAWLCYRIGDAGLIKQNLPLSIEFLERAVKIKPLALDFQNKLGSAYLDHQQTEKAKKVFQFIVNENPRHALAQNNLGYIALLEKNIPLAKKYFQQAVMLDPDHVQSLINLAVCYHETGALQWIQPILYHALKLEPGNEQVKAMLNEMEGR